MRRLIIVCLFLACTFSSACGYEIKEDGIFAVMNTSMGEMVAKLYYDKVPITVGNFVGLVEGTKEYVDIKTGKKKKGNFYKGLIFHRVIKGFMIQGGCPLGAGNGNPGYSFVDEFKPDLKHNSAGILSMANSGPNTNGSQFFITLAPTPHLDGRHTVWGNIIHGMDVLKEIGELKTVQRDKPKDDVVIESIEIKRIGKDAIAFDAEKAFAYSEELLKKLDEESEKNIKEFLKKLNVNEKRILKTSSGLKYYVRRRGRGKKPEKGDTITAHYSGYLADGTKFDSSYDRGKPFDVAIGVRRVIQGWDEAFLNMRRGEKRVLIIPHDLAYGPRGKPPVIPPRATLIFEVELLKVKKKK